MTQDLINDRLDHLENQIEIININLNAILACIARLETLEASLTEKKLQDDSPAL